MRCGHGRAKCGLRYACPILALTSQLVTSVLLLRLVKLLIGHAGRAVALVHGQKYGQRLEELIKVDLHATDEVVTVGCAARRSEGQPRSTRVAERF